MEHINTKFKVLYKWNLENGITLMPDTIIDIVAYGNDTVCIGHPTFSQVIWVKKIDFDANCISIDFR
jgi:hypothetical protein